MNQPDLLRRVSARYRERGRFARHYVAAKLRRDPLTAALLAAGPLGTVADLGCGRGQFAALLLESGQAHDVTGLERNPTLLADATAALAGLPFAGHAQDLATDPALPETDTVLMLDMLYQLPTQAQSRLLRAATRSARHTILIRTANPAARLTRLLEHGFRRIWPHSGATVNAQPVDWIAGHLREGGFAVDIAPCHVGTPFGNVLVKGRKEALLS